MMKGDRELIFEALDELKSKSETLNWELNFDDFEILSINFLYHDEDDEEKDK